MLAVFVPLLAIPLIVLAATLLATLILFLLVFWIWMLVSAIQNKGLTDGEKTGWVLGIVFFHLFGSLLYFFIGPAKTENTVAGNLIYETLPFTR